MKVIERCEMSIYGIDEGMVCRGGKTKQAHKGECDVNKIVARARKAGSIDGLLSDKRPVYADVSNLNSFQELQNRLISANDDFMKLPVKTRKLFEHKVVNMVNYLLNVKDTEVSIKEAVELGVLPKAVLDAKIAERLAIEEGKGKAEVPPAQ